MVKQFRQRKSTQRIGRSYRRKMGKSRIQLKKGFLIHYFKRTYKTSQSITNATFQALKPTIAASSGNFNDFRLEDLPNFSDFTNLYDSYKINGIKVKHIFNRNSSESNGSTSEIPRLITVNDYNDTANLGSEAEAMEYSSCKQSRMDKFAISRYFRPTQQLTASTDTQLNVVKSRWNSTAEADIKHFGLKEAVITSGSVSSTCGTVDTYVTFYIACRTPR